MPKRKHTNSKFEKEKAITGYEQAIALWIFTANQGWEIFNIMLICNSIIIAAIGLAPVNMSRPISFSILLPILGLTLCIVWYVLTKRNVDYARYYILSAREIEEIYLSDTVNTVSRGNDFTEGKDISIKLKGSTKKIRMNLLSRTIRASNAGYWIIIIFVIVYSSTLLELFLT